MPSAVANGPGPTPEMKLSAARTVTVGPDGRSSGGGKTPDGSGIRRVHPLDVVSGQDIDPILARDPTR